MRHASFSFLENDVNRFILLTTYLNYRICLSNKSASSKVQTSKFHKVKLMGRMLRVLHVPGEDLETSQNTSNTCPSSTPGIPFRMGIS